MRTGLQLILVALLPLNSIASSHLGKDASHSLFDQLTLRHNDSDRDMPYPFPLLLQHLSKRAGFDTDVDPFAKIMIPRGRSLQREAARPDYYAFPRIVIALDRAADSPRLLKNRLFLGYQERAQTIEIISYNETVGRFEFQIVHNYGPNKIPRVAQASRELCVGCHQNSAAIFSRPLWRETNFNPQVAGLIGKHHRRYQGIGTSTTHADADRIDFATDQAGLFHAYQRIWQQGCPNHDCRAKLFLASILRGIGIKPDNPYLRTALEHELLLTFKASWPTQWPSGMPVISADIPDEVLSADDDTPVPLITPLFEHTPVTHWSAHTAFNRALEGLPDQFWPDIYIDQLRQLVIARNIDATRVTAAVGRMSQNPAYKIYFSANPISGVALLQALMEAIEMSR